MQNINVIICIILNFCCLNKYFSNEEDDEDSCCCKWCEDKITKNNTDKQQSEKNNNKNIEKGPNNNNSDNEKGDEENIEEEEKEEEEKEEEEIQKEFTNTKTLLGHENKVAAITQLKSGKLATGGYDNTIRIWDINNKEKTTADKIINEKGQIFVLLEFEENKLLSGTANNIHLWDLNSNSEIYEKSFEGHILWVMGLVKIDNKRNR